MQIRFQVNGRTLNLDAAPGETLLRVLRHAGFYSVKHGCETGDCGTCAVLLDGQLVNACSMLAVQADGHSILTVEGLGSHTAPTPEHVSGLHVLQEEFAASGAIQCGYCTPGMLIAAKSLLDRKGYGRLDKPEAIGEEEVRECLSGVLCRCTGYAKPVEAVLKTAARLRGEESKPLRPAPATAPHRGIGKSEVKLDALKLAQGKPVFTDDIVMRETLIAKVLYSPVAHARIKIDVQAARALPGVAAVLTYRDLPRVLYSTAGQSDPLPSPLDTCSLDSKVRFVGDRVAFVAAETEELAQRALELIEVEYEELPVVVDPREAMRPGAPVIHDETDYVHFDLSDPRRNLAAHVEVNIGDVDKGMAQADYVFEGEYIVPKVQQASLEPHVVITYWDDDDRLVIRSSTQVPFHARRVLAPVLGLPVKRIRVVKPRIGGGFGGKQEVLIEDVAAHLTMATGQPVRFEYSRGEEFTSARSRHPMRIRLRTGVQRDGTITANEMYALSDTGAYGSHALTVAGNCGQKSMALYVGDGPYRCHPNIRFTADAVYTNSMPSGAFRGYGVPQGFFAVEVQMERIANSLGLDPLAFRLKNSLRQGELQPFSTVWTEGGSTRPEYIRSCGLEECVRRGAAAIHWETKRGNVDWHRVPGKPQLRRGIGAAVVMQGTAISYTDMGGASLKINEDGSFNLLVGATDIGTGSDTVLAQMAAEVLGCPVDDIVVYSSDTDLTPFDTGAYASSTTYISGGAVVKAAEQVAKQIREVAAAMLGDQHDVNSEELALADGRVTAPDGRSVTLAQVAMHSLHYADQRQIMSTASFMSPVAPPPFAAQFAEVTVDTETGAVQVEHLVTALDSGVIVNPLAAEGQVEGAMTQALGYAVCEEMTYDPHGRPLVQSLHDYHIFSADEMPELTALFVETFEPSHPLGVKAVGEVPMDGIAPAIVNAIHDAAAIWLNEIPATPERIWKALQEQNPMRGAERLRGGFLKFGTVPLSPALPNP